MAREKERKAAWVFCLFRYGISQEKRPDSLLTLSLHSSSRSGDDEPKQLACCPECKRKYEKEAALLQEQEGNAESESPQSCNSSVEVCNKTGWIDESTRRAEISSGANLPLWLQKALPSALSKGPPMSAEVRILCPVHGLPKRFDMHFVVCRSMYSSAMLVASRIQTNAVHVCICGYFVACSSSTSICKSIISLIRYTLAKDLNFGIFIYDQPSLEI
jgi:hypothetical protein